MAQIPIIPGNEPFGFLRPIAQGAVQGFGQRQQRRDLIGAAQGFGGNAELAKALKGLPLGVGQQLFTQALLQQQQARTRASAPTTPLEQARIKLLQAQTAKLGRDTGAGAGLDNNQVRLELGRLRDDNRALDTSDRATNADFRKGEINKEEALTIKKRNASRRNSNNQAIRQLRSGRGPAPEQPSAALPTPFAQTEAGKADLTIKKERARIAADPVEQLLKKAEREDSFSEKRFLLGDLDGANKHAARANTFIKQAQEIEKRVAVQVQENAKQAARAEKYGLTTAEMKEETAGRNGGPSDDLAFKYVNFLRALTLSNVADVDIAEQLRAKGIPLQAIMKRAGTPTK